MGQSVKNDHKRQKIIIKSIKIYKILLDLQQVAELSRPVRRKADPPTGVTQVLPKPTHFSKMK
jgi:hypothetical protein